MQPGLQGKTLRKKIHSRREEDFISANPSGPGLSGNPVVQKFATQNAFDPLADLITGESQRKKMNKK